MKNESKCKCNYRLFDKTSKPELQHVFKYRIFLFLYVKPTEESESCSTGNI